MTTIWILISVLFALVLYLIGKIWVADNTLDVHTGQINGILGRKDGSIEQEIKIIELQKENDIIRGLNVKQADKIKKLKSDLDKQWKYSKDLYGWNKEQVADFNNLRDVAVKLEQENERLRAKLGMDSLAPSAVINEVTVIKQEKADLHGDFIVPGEFNTDPINPVPGHTGTEPITKPNKPKENY